METGANPDRVFLTQLELQCMDFVLQIEATVFRLFRLLQQFAHIKDSPIV